MKRTNRAKVPGTGLKESQKRPARDIGAGHDAGYHRGMKEKQTRPDEQAIDELIKKVLEYDDRREYVE